MVEGGRSRGGQGWRAGSGWGASCCSLSEYGGVDLNPRSMQDGEAFARPQIERLAFHPGTKITRRETGTSGGKTRGEEETVRFSNMSKERVKMRSRIRGIVSCSRSSKHLSGLRNQRPLLGCGAGDLRISELRKRSRRTGSRCWERLI